MSHDWQLLERELRALVTALRASAILDDAQEVEMYLHAGEYGLAFETICSILATGGKPLSSTFRAQLAAIGERIGVDGTEWAAPIE